MKFGVSFNSLDLRLTKAFQFNERRSLQFTSEVLNLPNVASIHGFNNNNYSGFRNALTNDPLKPTILPSPQHADPHCWRVLRLLGALAFQFALRCRF